MIIDEYSKILSKYKYGRDLDESDRFIVEELCTIGLMNTGISIKRNLTTAKATSLGLKLL
jgi:hypothetical protein